MRRFRRRRGGWFPILPFSEGTIGRTDDRREIAVSFDTATPNVLWVPLIADDTINPENLGSQTSLRDVVEGQSCIIERVVGQVTWAFSQLAHTVKTPRLAVCCTALAVLPTDEAGDVGIPSDEFDPLRAQNSHQPYLWRRTWVLSNGASTIGQTERYFTVGTNVGPGSMKSGSFLDTKGTKRAIRKEERLFVIHSAMNADIEGGAGGEDGKCFVHFDLRVLGRMVRNSNKSTFK